MNEPIKTKKLESKILQISTVSITDCSGYFIVALCEDGTIWETHVGILPKDQYWVYVSGLQ
jgi:hypothetical protein